MLPGKVGQVSFTVSGGHGVVFRGRSSTRRRKLERGVPRGLPARLLRAQPRRDLPDHGPRGPGHRGLARLRGRARGHAVPPAGAQRGALLHLRARRRGRAVLRAGPAARQPHRPVRAGVRRPAVRQQRQPARHLPPDRRPGERVRRLVRRGRRVREVRLHRQLRRRAAAARRAGLPRHATRRWPAEAGFGLRWLAEAVAPGQEGPLHPGRHRQRQREQHHPGRLQLLVPAAGRGPA